MEKGKNNNKKIEQETEGKSDIEKNRGITYLSYIGLLFLVPLLVSKDSKFAQFHAKQGLVLTAGWFVGVILTPFFGLGVLVQFFVLILSIMGLVNVNKGEMKKLPVIGDFADKINL